MSEISGAESAGWFGRLKAGLRRSATALGAGVTALATKRRLDQAALRELEELLIGADLGAEKFFDIKCRKAGLNPSAAVIVATVRALKMHGGVAKDDLKNENAAAVAKGCDNLKRHLENVKKFGVPPIVAINRFITDTDAEIAEVIKAAEQMGTRAFLCTHWADGGKGIDTLTGGLGSDTYTFNTIASVVDSGIGPGNRDVIRDFEGAGATIADIINLQAIVADGVDGVFAFLGTVVFSGDASGLLRVTSDGAGGTLVQGSTDADTDAEFEIQLVGVDPNALIAADFIL